MSVLHVAMKRLISTHIPIVMSTKHLLPHHAPSSEYQHVLQLVQQLAKHNEQLANQVQVTQERLQAQQADMERAADVVKERMSTAVPEDAAAANQDEHGVHGRRRTPGLSNTSTLPWFVRVAIEGVQGPGREGSYSVRLFNSS